MCISSDFTDPLILHSIIVGMTNTKKTVCINLLKDSLEQAEYLLHEYGQNKDQLTNIDTSNKLIS